MQRFLGHTTSLLVSHRNQPGRYTVDSRRIFNNLRKKILSATTSLLGSHRNHPERYTVSSSRFLDSFRWDSKSLSFEDTHFYPLRVHNYFHCMLTVLYFEGAYETLLWESIEHCCENLRLSIFWWDFIKLSFVIQWFFTLRIYCYIFSFHWELITFSIEYPIFLLLARN